jgi:TonB family protein
MRPRLLLLLLCSSAACREKPVPSAVPAATAPIIAAPAESPSSTSASPAAPAAPQAILPSSISHDDCETMLLAIDVSSDMIFPVSPRLRDDLVEDIEAVLATWEAEKKKLTDTALVGFGDALALTLNEQLALLRGHLYNLVPPLDHPTDDWVVDESIAADVYDGEKPRRHTWVLDPRAAPPLARAQADLSEKWNALLRTCRRPVVRVVMPDSWRNAELPPSGVRFGATTMRGPRHPDYVKRVVQKIWRRYLLCYENGLLRDPNLRGRVSVGFVIDPDGAVSDVRDAKSDMLDAAVVRCVVRAFRSLSFPPEPKPGPNETVVYPMTFRTTAK